MCLYVFMFVVQVLLMLWGSKYIIRTLFVLHLSKQGYKVLHKFQALAIYRETQQSLNMVTLWGLVFLMELRLSTVKVTVNVKVKVQVHTGLG